MKPSDELQKEFLEVWGDALTAAIDYFMREALASDYDTGLLHLKRRILLMTRDENLPSRKTKHGKIAARLVICAMAYVSLYADYGVLQAWYEEAKVELSGHSDPGEQQ